jgi:hypothetical protein
MGVDSITTLLKHAADQTSKVFIPAKASTKTSAVFFERTMRIMIALERSLGNQGAGPAG